MERFKEYVMKRKSLPHTYLQTAFSGTPTATSSCSKADVLPLRGARGTIWLSVYSSHRQECEASLTTERKGKRHYWTWVLLNFKTINANGPSTWFLLQSTENPVKWRKASIKEHVQNAHNYSKIVCFINHSKSGVWGSSY